MGDKVLMKDGTQARVVALSADGRATVATAPGRLYTVPVASLRLR